MHICECCDCGSESVRIVEIDRPTSVDVCLFSYEMYFSNVKWCSNNSVTKAKVNSRLNYCLILSLTLHVQSVAFQNND